ncbi:hypothetical protein BGX28_008862 [Mortierella sp. GBA30]|nr:hypothetical protein BGX28_008862 [Mortierella sp. GBA30]
MIQPQHHHPQQHQPKQHQRLALLQRHHTASLGPASTINKDHIDSTATSAVINHNHSKPALIYANTIDTTTLETAPDYTSTQNRSSTFPAFSISPSSSSSSITQELSGSENDSSGLASLATEEGQSSSGCLSAISDQQVGKESQSLETGTGTEESAPEEPGTGVGAEGTPPWTKGLTARFQDHLKLFFSIHHKLFDLVAFYVVMFAINGQMTSLPTRLEWIGFCVQSVVALRRAFQTSIKHGIGLTSFLGMLDLLVGQLFLHQDRLGLLPTVANILVYFYVINLTRGLVFGDSVSCLLWFLFGLVDIYRKDPSSASILDLTPYKVIPVHTVGFGLYILMSELVDVMLHSAEPDPIPGRYLNYVGTQKEGRVSLRSSSRRPSGPSSDPSNSLRFELCITEITPFTVSFCLNALSDPLQGEQPSKQNPNSSGSFTARTTAAAGGELAKNTTTPPTPTNETIDLSAIKIGSAASASSSSASSSRQPKSITTPRIISTSDIVIHVNYIPWRQVQYHFPDDQSFTLYGLTPSTDYEIEMKVHQFSSFIARVGTRAAPPGTPIPNQDFEKITKPLDPVPKNGKNRKSRKGQKNQKDGDVSKSKATASTTGTSSTPPSAAAVDMNSSKTTGSSPQDSTPPLSSNPIENLVPRSEQKNPNEILLEQLQESLRSAVDATATTKALLKKLKKDQGKVETLLRQELEGIGRGQAKALVQDQKRRQKLSFIQESIKQTDASSSALHEEIQELRESTISIQPKIDQALESARELEQKIQVAQSSNKAEITPLKQECQHLKVEIKRLEGERAEWVAKAAQLREGEVAPLQLRLQRLEQQQIVWKVAAEANKDKDREATVRIAALEEDVQRLKSRALELEESIQEFVNKNMELKESLGKEMEIWEGLERESDEDDYALSNVFQLQVKQMSHQGHQDQDPQYFDTLMVEAPLHESRYWFSGGASQASGSDLWASSGVSLPLSGSGLSLGLGDSSRMRSRNTPRDMQSEVGVSRGRLWEMPELGSLLDSSKSRLLPHE